MCFRSTPIPRWEEERSSYSNNWVWFNKKQIFCPTLDLYFGYSRTCNTNVTFSNLWDNILTNRVLVQQTLFHPLPRAGSEMWFWIIHSQPPPPLPSDTGHFSGIEEYAAWNEGRMCDVLRIKKKKKTETSWYSKSVGLSNYCAKNKSCCCGKSRLRLYIRHCTAVRRGHKEQYSTN
jgi:hypothetical protein